MTRHDQELITNAKESGDIPTHIAMIMDGNGRWAKRKGYPRVAGHRQGVETVREMVESCSNIGVKYLTLYTFSTENWKRPKDEISTLMRLIVKSLQNETDELHKNNVRLTTIGNLKSLPEIVRNELMEATEKTKMNTALTLNLALSYSGRWELTEAVKNITRLYAENKIDIDDIDERLISNNLTTADMPDPDLLIRTGGEFRISNYLLWQIAYTEIFVSDLLWPDFRCKNLIDAISDYQKRERRFGLVSEQISSKTEKKNDVDSFTKEVAGT
ncbi:MAG: isoprenyl transferase [Melioribacteraceae bacterium]|nr:isoprenyl transferase [Melioribacteraceae bacterium]MCF8264058.1 isoprenyl transferase [Melioribacteraceae bacterium]MCF8411870.1 isoprenyl transferase [Melioribacteraceae bacterium]MCF8432234.1 isoprenyl transferase [Melioribacteraceae bacterium]